MAKKAKEYIEVELTAEDAAAAKVLCARKGLPFPEGLSFLVKEVVQQKGDNKALKKSGKKSGKR